MWMCHAPFAWKTSTRASCRHVAQMPRCSPISTSCVLPWLRDCNGTCPVCAPACRAPLPLPVAAAAAGEGGEAKQHHRPPFLVVRMTRQGARRRRAWHRCLCARWRAAMETRTRATDTQDLRMAVAACVAKSGDFVVRPLLRCRPSCAMRLRSTHHRLPSMKSGRRQLLWSRRPTSGLYAARDTSMALRSPLSDATAPSIGQHMSAELADVSAEVDIS